MPKPRITQTLVIGLVTSEINNPNANRAKFFPSAHAGRDFYQDHYGKMSWSATAEQGVSMGQNTYAEVFLSEVKLPLVHEQTIAFFDLVPFERELLMHGTPNRLNLTRLTQLMGYNGPFLRVLLESGKKGWTVVLPDGPGPWARITPTAKSED